MAKIEKKTTGRKRHIAVNTSGRPLPANLTTIDISDEGFEILSR